MRNIYSLQDHFTEDQFELKRADHKRLLKWNAVPTIFSHNKTNNCKTSLNQETVTTVLGRRDVPEEIVTENVKLGSRIKQELNLRTARSDGDPDEIAVLRRELNSSRKQIHTLKTIISQLQAIIERLVEENYIDDVNEPV